MNPKPNDNRRLESVPPTEPKRRQLSVDITASLHENFKEFTRRHGVSMGDACGQAVHMWMQAVEERDQTLANFDAQAVLQPANKKPYHPSSTEQLLFGKLLSHSESRAWLFRFAVVLYSGNKVLVRSLLCTIGLYFDRVRPIMTSPLSLDDQPWGRDAEADAETIAG